MQAGSALSSATTASTSAWVALAGRSRRMLAIPISAQSRVLGVDVPAAARVVADQDGAEPGHDCPRRPAATTRAASSALIVGQGRLAVQDGRRHGPQSCQPRPAPPGARRSARSVGEVAGAGEVHGDARGLRRPRSPRRRGSNRRAGRRRARRASRSTCGPSANGKNASEAATEPARALAGPGDREAAGVDAVDLAHADADGGAVAGQQDRVRLDRPDRTPGEGQVGQGGVVGRRGPAASCQDAGSSPGASMRSAVCSSIPPETAPRLDGRAVGPAVGPAAAAGSASRVSASSASGVERRGHEHLGEHVGELAGHRGGDRRLAAITPPYALTGSQACAARCASAMSAPTAMPHGLACLMIATHGSAKS